MRLGLFIFACALFALSGQAQTISLSDSLSHVFREKVFPSAKLDSRNSLVSGRSARINGVKVGVSFGKKMGLGLGYNWMEKGITQYVKVNGEEKKTEVRLGYIASYVEYSFYKKGSWEAVVPVQLGFGKSHLHYNSPWGKQKLHSGNVMLYEPGMNVEYKILNLIGVGAGVGYRIMLMNNRGIDQRFTSPVYVLRFRVIFDELYRQAKKWKENE